MDEGKLQSRVKSLQEEFASLDTKRKALVEQRSNTSREINEIAGRQTQIQGAFTEVSSLLNGEKETVEELKAEKPKEPKKK